MNSKIDTLESKLAGKIDKIEQDNLELRKKLAE